MIVCDILSLICLLLINLLSRISLTVTLQNVFLGGSGEIPISGLKHDILKPFLIKLLRNLIRILRVGD